MNPFNLELVLPRVNLEPNSRIEVLELKVSQGDQLYMALYFWYLVHWTSHF